MKAVHVRQFTQGTAELALDYAGKSAAVAEGLANQKFTGFRLEPTSVTPNRLDVQAVLETGMMLPVGLPSRRSRQEDEVQLT